MLPGPFAYAERWDEKTDTYLGLAIERADSAIVIVDSEASLLSPTLPRRTGRLPPRPAQPSPAGGPETPGEHPPVISGEPGGGTPGSPVPEKRPSRFTGTVMISADRPAREMHQIVEAIVNN